MVKTSSGEMYCKDYLEVLPNLPDNSIDMILCDLPYNMTKNSWEHEIDLDKLWHQYERIIKPNGAIVLFGQDKFSAKLMLSNEKLHRYNLIWEKTTSTGFLNAKKMPLRSHEDILIFYKKLPTYNPQKTTGHKPVNSYTKHTSDGTNYGKTKTGVKGGGSTERYPKSVTKFASDKQKSALHPTQKPVALCSYLIKTFSDEGDTVLDNCAGSFTTAVSCIETNRKFICIEMDKSMFEKGSQRVLSKLSQVIP